MQRYAHAAPSVDATITVTPVANVTLTLDTTFYDFGTVNVNSSTSSITALRLTNTGEVYITVDKQITTQSNPVGWTAGTSTGLDRYVLYCATSTAQPSLSSFTASTQFGAQGNVTALTGPAGTSPVMPVRRAPDLSKIFGSVWTCRPPFPVWLHAASRSASRGPRNENASTQSRRTYRNE